MNKNPLTRLGNEKLRSFSVLFLFLLILSIFSALSLLKKGKPLPREVTMTLAPPAIVPSLFLKEYKEVIQKGATLSTILAKHNFSPSEIHQLKEEVRPVIDLNRIRCGQELRLFLTEEGTIDRLEYDLDKENFLLIHKEGGKYKALVKGFPFEIRTEMIWGEIEDDLISAINQNNEGDILALSLAEIFAWDIDFYMDLRQGDTFRIIFEKKYLKGKFIDYRHILSAEFINQGKYFQAFRYTYPDTKQSDYFDGEGNSLRKEFLKSPIKFARITSRFRLRRLHPIHRVYRPHLGVDYAASVGTPVQATAAGTVTFIGWNGTSGRMIEIRHKNGYETKYLHLRNYAPGIKRGAKVESGQVIGSVGSSGESTGPHLDYRITYRGKYINPLSFRFKPVQPIRPEFLDDFKGEVEKYLLLFDAPLALLQGFK